MADSKEMERRWEVLFRADTALSLATYVPWKAIGVVLLALVPTVLALIAHLPLWAISLVTLGGLALVLMALLLVLRVMESNARRRFAMARPVVAVESSAPNDRQLALWFTHQADEAIREIRDKRGAEVKVLYQMFNMHKEASRWLGRTEYVAEQVRQRYPNEVSEFLSSPGTALDYPVALNDVLNERNRLQAHITWKAERLRKLAQVMAR